MRGTLRQRSVAWILARLTGRYQAMLADRKRDLFREVRGQVLEIGPGTGPNLKYYPGDIHWIGLEPNPYTHPYLQQEIQSCHLNAELRTGYAEKIPADSGSIDVVVATLVLCSVGNPDAALQEVLRVLKPGGRFVFVEHVAAPRGTGLRCAQRLFRPFSLFLAECHPDRETWITIGQAGFNQVNYEHFRVPIPIDSPHIAGVARK